MTVHESELPAVLNSDQAAQLMQCSREYIQSAAREGLLPGWRVGGRGQWKFSRDKLIQVVSGDG